MAIILFVAIVALSTTLVTTKAYAAEYCAHNVCYIAPTMKEAKQMHDIQIMNYIESNGTRVTNETVIPTINTMTKACQSDQDMINIDKDLGVDPNLITDLQKALDDTCN